MIPPPQPLALRPAQQNAPARVLSHSDSGEGDEAVGRLADRFSFGRLLGSGSYADVWECTETCSPGRDGCTELGCPGTDEGMHLYACKVISKSRLVTRESKEAVRKEVEVLQRLRSFRHPGIVRLKEVVEGQLAVHIIMERCSGGDLFELLKSHGPLPERAAKLVFCQLASALALCHSQGVFHRDIKPENVLFNAPALTLYSIGHTSSTATPHLPRVQAMLSDFGLAEIVSPGGTAQGYVGSRHYVAPEIVLGLPYGRRADVWSLGVVLCTMLTGKLPFHGRTHDDAAGLRAAVLRGQVNFRLPCWDGVSESAKDLTRRMLELEPQFRMAVPEVLAHPWCREFPQEQVFSDSLSCSSTENQGPRSRASLGFSENGFGIPWSPLHRLPAGSSPFAAASSTGSPEHLGGLGQLSPLTLSPLSPRSNSSKGRNPRKRSALHRIPPLSCPPPDVGTAPAGRGGHPHEAAWCAHGTTPVELQAAASHEAGGEQGPSGFQPVPVGGPGHASALSAHERTKTAAKVRAEGYFQQDKRMPATRQTGLHGLCNRILRLAGNVHVATRKSGGDFQ